MSQTHTKHILCLMNIRPLPSCTSVSGPEYIYTMQACGKSASHGTANNTSQSDSLEMLIFVFKYLHVHLAYNMLHCCVQTTEDDKNLEIAKSNVGGSPETV